jgi:hypothetical protein
MSVEVASLMGSGTSPYTAAILHTTLGGTFGGTLNAGAAAGRGVRTGTQVIVSNPEDIVSVPAIRCSGISVGTSPVNILNQINHDALLKRGRMAIIENLGPGDLYVGGRSNVTTGLAGESGFKLLAPAASIPPQSIELPIMNGCDVWAVASAGATDVRILVY